MTTHYWLRRRAQYLWNAVTRVPLCRSARTFSPEHLCSCRREATHLGLHQCRCGSEWWRRP